MAVRLSALFIDRPLLTGRFLVPIILQKKNSVAYLWVWLYTGYELVNWIYRPLGTISNHNAIANLYTSQIIAAPAKPFPASRLYSRSLATASNSRDSSASRARVLLSQPPVQNSCQQSSQLQRHLSSASLAEFNWTANPQLTGSQASGYFTPTS
jgi:hypothetical protein